jgi:hypothetical protein
MPLISPQKINYEDGSWEFVREPSFFTRLELIPVIDDMLDLLRGVPIYPPNAALKDDITVHQFLVYRSQRHLEAIALIFRRTQPDLLLSIDRLTTDSRHKFFFCTQPVKPVGYDQEMPGLSQLQLLMGLTYPAKQSRQPKQSKEKSAPLSTGNLDARIIAAVHLNFKGSGNTVLENFGMGMVMDILEEATNLQKDPKDAEKEQRFPTISRTVAIGEIDREYWDEVKGDIAEALRDRGIQLPEGF